MMHRRSNITEKKCVDKICTTLFLTHTGKFCSNLKPIHCFCLSQTLLIFVYEIYIIIYEKIIANILSSNTYFDIYICKSNPVCTYCATSRYSRMGVAHRHFSSKEKNLGRNSRSSTSSHVILHTKLYIPCTTNTWWQGVLALWEFHLFEFCHCDFSFT